MTAVWYTGKAAFRRMKSADWTKAGTTGTDVSWDSSNGWSIPTSEFTSAQLAILDLSDDFDVNAADGPRTGSGGGGGSTSAVVYPVGLGTIATAKHAQHSTGFTIDPTLRDIPGMVIVVPPTDRDVWVHYQGYVGISSEPSPGWLYLLLWELTGGVAVPLDNDVHYSYGAGADPISPEYIRLRGSCNVGPSDLMRIFSLHTQAVGGVVGYLRNTDVTIGGATWMTAEAR